MIKKLTFIIHLAVSFTFLLGAQDGKSTLSKSEMDELNEAIQADSNLSLVLSWFGDPIQLYEDYKRNLILADSIWSYDQENLNRLDIGTTERFELLPLVDWFTDNDSLIGESAVSYLIRTDDATILFDFGLNAKNSHPSPLLYNMDRLGIKIEDINIIVISHNHSDHIGGSKWNKENTFSFTNHQLELEQIPVYTPNEMTYPGIVPTFTPKPTKISKGVATIGVIHNPIFALDIAEQALAINVKNKGVVVISGCGHQSMKNIIERTNIIFEDPLYAILGGFHYPIEEERNITWLYKYFVVNKLPWERLTIEDVNSNINLLKENGVKLVGISGHDSCDKSINSFKRAFGDNYMDIKVGHKIVLSD